jgi:AcrR family transcriptional regulator
MPQKNTHQEKKEKILTAALQAYAKYGIADATTRQVAEIAGIGKSTIFEYFKNSEELMDSAFEYYIGQVSSQWEALRSLAQADPGAALSAYFDSLLELILHQPGKLLLISQYATAILACGREFADVKKQYAMKLQPSADSLMEQFKHIVAVGMQSGAFQPVNGASVEDCTLLLSAIAREMQAQAFIQEEIEIKQTCQRLKRMAFTLLGASNIER